MELNENIDLTKRKFTSRLIVERALARNWKIVGFKTNPAVFLVYIPGRKTPVQIFSASPPQISYPASKIAKDKYITNRILAERGIPVPDEMLVTLDSQAKDREIKKFLDKHKKIVVKPLDGAHGKGITVNVSNLEMLEKALAEARDNTIQDSILIQEQISGIDVRIVIINYKVIGAISRTPASVIGDGVHNIRQLIELTNASDDRGINYRAPLNIIPIDKVERFLSLEELAHTPAEDEEVQVIGVSNIGMGGLRRDIHKITSNFMKDIAIKAAKTLELPVCGIDFIIKQLPSPESTQEDLNLRVIEANACPSLPVCDDVNSPEQLAVIDNYLDYVAKC